MLESSIRGASVLGLVGAGGIGQRLCQELNHLRYDRGIINYTNINSINIYYGYD